MDDGLGRRSEDDWKGEDTCDPPPSFLNFHHQANRCVNPRFIFVHKPKDANSQDEKKNRLRSDCLQISLYDALDPSFHYLNIGGVNVHKNSFPHPDQLIFIIGQRSLIQFSPTIYKCVSYSSIEKEFYANEAHVRIQNFDNVDYQQFVICKWFQSFTHNYGTVLYKKPSVFDEICNCQKPSLSIEKECES